MSSFPWLTVIGAIPLAGAVLLAGLPRRSGDVLAKWLALGFSLATLVFVIVMAVRFSPSGPDFQFTQTYQWIPAFGVHYAVGVDGIALVLIGLTAVLMPVVVLATWNDADSGLRRAGGALASRRAGGAPAGRSVKTYFALMLVMETMVIGAFA